MAEETKKPAAKKAAEQKPAAEKKAATKAEKPEAAKEKAPEAKKPEPKKEAEGAVKKIGPSLVEITYVVSKDDWKKAQSKAYAKLASQVTVKGFRKGQAPASLTARLIDPNRLFDEAVNDSLPEAYSHAIEDNKVRPYGQPSVRVSAATGDSLTLVFTVSLLPTVVLGKYKGLHAEKEAPAVTDKEVDDQIAHQLSDAATLEVVDRPAQLGDTVTLDFEGFIDGKPFDGGKAENYALELGSNSFVPGFEDALVGAKAEDKRDVNITFPTNYVKELAGKPATFKCKIHEVKAKKVPELNDDAVKDMAIDGVNTVSELKEKTKKDLLTSKVNAAEEKYFDEIVAQIVKDSQIELAEAIVADEAKHTMDDLKSRVSAQGLTFEQYLEITGSKEDALLESMKHDAEANLKRYLVLQEIGAQEKIEVLDEDLEKEYAKMAERYGMKAEDVKKALASQENQVRSNIRDQKIRDFILANSK